MPQWIQIMDDAYSRMPILWITMQRREIDRTSENSKILYQ